MQRAAGYEQRPTLQQCARDRPRSLSRQRGVRCDNQARESKALKVREVKHRRPLTSNISQRTIVARAR